MDGCRVDRAQKSSIIKKSIPGTVFFSESITYAPYTNSSMFAVLSGSYGNRNGCYSYWHSSKFKSSKFKTITQYLHDENYYTYADIHSEIVIPSQGFDEFKIYDETRVNLSNRHKELLTKMKVKSDAKKNFFLYLHYSGIHTGIMKSVLKVYNNFSKEYFENRKLNEERYDHLFLNAEEYLKIILDKIKELDLDKNSIILLISDHGMSVGEKFGERAYGAFCYDYTIKTFSCYIESTFEDKEIKQQVRHVDFMPTILNHLEIDLDKNFESLDGVSLLPLILENKYIENIAYSETGNPLNDKAPPKKPNVKSVRTSNWKLIFNEYNNTKELYNLREDPTEEKNLIGQVLGVEEELWKKLLACSQV